MPSTKRGAAKDAPARSRSQKAYEACARARAALSSAELVAVNIDILAAVASVQRTIPRLARFERAAASGMPALSDAGLAYLRACIYAVTFAQAVYLSIEKDDDPVPALFAQATDLLDLLLLGTEGLVLRGLLDRREIASLKRSTGYVKTATTLGLLARILRDRWPAIAARAPILVEELDEAERLAKAIPQACADRGVATAVKVKAATEERQRAYTLFLRAYDEVRRSIAYLRWNEGDAETIAPSLWAGRGGRGKATAKPAREPRAGNARAGDSGGGAGEDRGEAQSTERDAAGARSRLH